MRRRRRMLAARNAWMNIEGAAAMSPILTAGGGIAGLATAIALANGGRDVLVLEQAAAFEEVGAGIQMGPNGRRALEALGAWEALAEKVVYPQAIRIRKAASGKELARVPLGDAFRERFGTAYQVVHRADLLNALLAVARETGRVELRTGARVERFDFTGRGVMAWLADGAFVNGSLLIGADGIRSAVREQVVGDGPPRLSGHVLYRALVEADQVPDMVDTSSVNLWLHRGGHVVHYPVSGGKHFNIVAAVDEAWEDEGWSTPSDGEILTHTFAKVADELAAVLALPEGRWLRWAAADREPVEGWSQGRATLIGDAAHPTLPYLASGAVMALEDAVVLGRALDREKDAAAAFRAHERARQPRTAQIVRRSHKLAKVYHASGPMALGRDLYLKSRDGEKSLEDMAWLYDWRPFM